MDNNIWYDIYEDDLEEFSEYENVWEDGENMADFEPPSFYDMVQTCVIPTATEMSMQIGKVLLCGCVIRFCISLGFVPLVIIKLITVITGVWVMYQFFKLQITYLLLFSILIFVIFILNKRKIHYKYGNLAVIFTVSYLVICELAIADEKEWHMIRGTQMILAMKAISIGFDMDNKQDLQLPSFLTYLAYCVCPTTVIFGPWTSFEDFMEMLSRSSLMSLWWILKFLSSFLSAFAFLSLSTCWTSWLFHMSGQESSNKWISAFGDALSYRSSHYFVSFVSEASIAISGFSLDLKVVEPVHVEMPRSLVEVVTHWNIPVHFWLKNYVFKMARPYGTFCAIITTYAASSLLHGLNFQLAAVLLSLGFYTYTEFKLRQKLAKIFSACILSRKCRKDCDHIYKANHLAVITTNVLFGGIAVFHLAYLGVMFDSTPDLEETGYDMKHTLNKWTELDYASHWLALSTFGFLVLL